MAPIKKECNFVYRDRRAPPYLIRISWNSQIVKGIMCRFLLPNFT